VKIRIVSLATWLWLTPLVASASPILNIDQNGELLGASGVEVFTGVFYDVTFVDTSCIQIFKDCVDVDPYQANKSAEFAFHTSEDAAAASAALLSQVLLDGDLGLFDSVPELTFGCNADNTFRRLCGIYTPYLAPLGGPMLYAQVASNQAIESADGVGGGTEYQSYPTSGTHGYGAEMVWAVWTPYENEDDQGEDERGTNVPEGGDTLIMLGFAFAAIAGVRRLSVSGPVRFGSGVDGVLSAPVRQ
jgi:hypothetical protein